MEALVETVLLSTHTIYYVLMMKKISKYSCSKFDLATAMEMQALQTVLILFRLSYFASHSRALEMAPTGI